MPDFQIRRRSDLKSGFEFFTPSLDDDDGDNDDDSVGLQDPNNRERIKKFTETYPLAGENKGSMQPKYAFRGTLGESVMTCKLLCHVKCAGFDEGDYVCDFVYSLRICATSVGCATPDAFYETEKSCDSTHSLFMHVSTKRLLQFVVYYEHDSLATC